jgi:hypothetical protein
MAEAFVLAREERFENFTLARHLAAFVREGSRQ